MFWPALWSCLLRFLVQMVPENIVKAAQAADEMVLFKERSCLK